MEEIIIVMPDPILLTIMVFGGVIFYHSILALWTRVFKQQEPPMTSQRAFVLAAAFLGFFTFILPVLLWRDAFGPQAENLNLVALPIIFRYVSFVIGVFIAERIHHR